ncbi:hypothetical protein B0H11DRAFT_2236426 [Mycena galericulata]|nr:hypothetical protein B0H11DRAFT_2236426 [Mycena galericulata]
MHFTTILAAFFLGTGLAAGITLPEAAETEKRVFLSKDEDCLLANPGACCSGQCCCGFASPFLDGCDSTTCTTNQLEGLTFGHCGDN